MREKRPEPDALGARSLLCGQPHTLVSRSDGRARKSVLRLDTIRFTWADNAGNFVQLVWPGMAVAQRDWKGRPTEAYAENQRFCTGVSLSLSFNNTTVKHCDQTKETDLQYPSSLTLCFIKL